MRKKWILLVGLTLILAVSIFCGYQTHVLSAEQERVKEDYSIVNNVSFGLLSVNSWRDQVEGIISKQIQEFKLNSTQKEDLKKEVEQIMNSLLSEGIRKINQPTKTIGNKIKKMAFKAMVDTSSLHAQVPFFAQKIVDEVNRPSSRDRLKHIAQTKLEEMSRQTYDSAMSAMSQVTDSVFRIYSVNEKTGFDKKAKALLDSLHIKTYAYAYGLLATALLMFGLWLLPWNNQGLSGILYLFSVGIALVLLVVGVTTSMIELDARLKEMDFQLVGSTVSFPDEVLFFQSKSILSVVRILIETGKIDMLIVGILILCFSIFFPLAKLVSGIIYLYSNNEIKNNKVIGFFAFRSGKWSMADVTVVAIMMAYIGLNGVLASQLSNLNVRSASLTSITTNNTTLQPGYIIFVGFVIYGLFLSEKLKKIS